MMHAGIKGSSPFMSDALMREESRPAPAPAAKAKRTEAGFNCAAHGLRGIAALMVFSAHLLGGSAEHVYQDHSAYVQFVLRPWQFGVYGVYLFFTISGFVILPSVLRYSTGQFALRRFLRLYPLRSEEHTSELQSLMRISYAVFCLKKKHNITHQNTTHEEKNK